MTDIQELRRLLAEATPGPWMNVHGVALCRSHEDWLDANSPNHEALDDSGIEANAALIVAAVNALPALLDEVEIFRSQPDLKPIADLMNELARVRDEVERLTTENEQLRGELCRIRDYDYGTDGHYVSSLARAALREKP